MHEVLSSTFGLAIQTVNAKKWRPYKVGGLFSNQIHALEETTHPVIPWDNYVVLVSKRPSFSFFSG